MLGELDLVEKPSDKRSGYAKSTLLLQSAAKPKPAKCGGGLDCIGDGNWHFCLHSC
jgi:hypothetical protein